MPACSKEQNCKTQTGIPSISCDMINHVIIVYTLILTVTQNFLFSVFTGWERTGQMLCIVDTSLSVLMTLRMCLRELCFYCLDLNHLVRVFYLFMFS